MKMVNILGLTVINDGLCICRRHVVYVYHSLIECIIASHRRILDGQAEDEVTNREWHSMF